MIEGHWLLSFNVWQRIIRLILFVAFAWHVQLHAHVSSVLVGAWKLLWDRIWPSTQFFVSLSALLEFSAIFLLFYSIFVFWLAQFILPVTRWRERGPAAWRLFVFSLFWGHLHGPAVFVHNGETDADLDELGKSGPGVAFVDLRSAITLNSRPRSKEDLSPANLERPERTYFDEKTNTYVSNVRVAGPGLVFIEEHERLTDWVDLRKQSRTRKGVQADTRDAIRVKTDISCTFTLGEPPDILDVCLGGQDGKQVFVIEWDTSMPVTYKRIKSLSRELDERDEREIYDFWIHHPDAASVLSDVPSSGFPYTLDEGRVEQAIYFQNLMPDPKPSSDLSFRKWSEVPQDVATEKFRILLSQQPYLKLYAPEDLTNFPLKDLKRELTRQVRNTGVLAYRLITLREGGIPEAQRLYFTSELVFYPPRNLMRMDVLRDRGIKVLSAGFGELEPVESLVRDHLIQSWRSVKQKEAAFKVADSNLEVARIRNQARVHAQQSMIYNLTQILEDQEYPREALAMLIYQELEAAAANPETRKLLPGDTLSLLTGIGTILLPADKTAARPGGGIPPYVPTDENDK
jgi:hypothetical protein